MAARRRQRLYARDSTGGIGQGLARQYARPHQGVVHSARRLPPLADRPNHQALPAPHVTAGKDLVHAGGVTQGIRRRSEEHTSELQSLMRISYAVFCLEKKKGDMYDKVV